MDALNQKFLEWSDFNSTHMNRLVSITYRHKVVLTGIANLWLKNHTFSIEDEEQVVSLHKELVNICEEVGEVYNDIGDDSKMFIEVLDLLRKELEKLPNDAPK